MKMIKCIMFDFGGTLMFFTDRALAAKVYTKLLRKRGFDVSYKNVKKLRDEEATKNLRRTYGDPSRHGGHDTTVIKNVVVRLGLKISTKDIGKLRKDFDKEMCKRFHLYPGTIPVLKCLKKRGYIIVILSNGTMSWVKKDLRRFKIKKYFDLIITSQEFGSEKSDLHMFRDAMKKFKLKPKECVMIGDRLDEDTHAKRLGIWTVHAAYGPDIPIVGRYVKPDFRIKSVPELLRIIEKLDKK